MVTFAQAQERADSWINGGVPQQRRREVKVREFELGFVAWAEIPAGGGVPEGSGARMVIARDSGDTTLWPALPVGEVIRRFEEEYGGEEAAAPRGAQPGERVDLGATSFLLTPPEWLQEAADQIGIPRRGDSGSSGSAGSGGRHAAAPAASPAPAQASAASGSGAPAAQASSSAPYGAGGSGPASPYAAGGAGPSGAPSGSVGPRVDPTAPAAAAPTPWNDTNSRGDDDAASVPLPETVLSAQLPDTPPPSGPYPPPPGGGSYPGAPGGPPSGAGTPPAPGSGGYPGAPAPPGRPAAPGAPPAPGSGSYPGAPGTPPPGAPAPPGAPNAPGAPGTPPGAPGAPPAPSAPAAPGAPVPPGPPAAPGAPGAPSVPGAPGAPGASSAPSTPSAPASNPGGGAADIAEQATSKATPLPPPLKGKRAPGGQGVPPPPGAPGMPPGPQNPANPPQPAGYGYPPPGVPTVGPGYLAVLRYRAQDGSEQQVMRRSAPGTPHPEWQILHELRGMGVPPQQVLELHTELEPCDLPGGYCSRMIRETWPQVRLSHTASYGRDHASRQQGMQQLIEHQGELHQVADGPARPRPQRVPLPPPGQIPVMPPLPPEALGHELHQAFGPQGVFRYDQRAVARQGVPDIVAQTLVWAGLPMDFGPFFWGQAQPGRPVPTLAELAAERGVQAASDAGSYLVMGNDFGRQMCVQYGTAHIVAVPLEAAPGGGSAPPQFVNTGLPEFVRCLAMLGHMWRMRFGLTPDQAGRWTVDFQSQLVAIDPAALQGPDHWWSVVLEQLWDGLL
ncbi:SUKH-4 family immunity protein [Streptomyces sp. B5E4]|uniref:SUKH-4 family immunity protein n=1 Tax=Streptomyces sp. B5E4 TaxID=3153568 RepID=UPI00325F3AE2